MSHREAFVIASGRAAVIRGLAVALWLVIGSGTLALAAALAFFAYLVIHDRRHAAGYTRSRTRSDSLEIRSAVLLYVGQEAGAPCPTMADLTAGGVLDSSRRTYDAWGKPFAIACAGDDIVVSSAGPDRRHGTADDIRP